MIHGTRNAYERHKCKCNECRSVNAARASKNRQRRYMQKTPPNIHGLHSTYVNWGCRCAECKSAKSLYNSEYRMGSSVGGQDEDS